jgi:hypothetical protein
MTLVGNVIGYFKNEEEIHAPETHSIECGTKNYDHITVVQDNGWNFFFRCN